MDGTEGEQGVVSAAHEHGITVNRISQGSGAMLLSVAELTEMAGIGAGAGIEVSLFVGPRHRDIAMAFQSYALYPHLNTERFLSQK